MAYSEVDVYNLALANIGQSVTIMSIDEQSKEAKVCRRFYELCRDNVLEDFPWPFATARAALADMGSPHDGWAFRYRYPNDCLFARGIVTSQRNPSASEKIPYAIFEDSESEGKCICTDQEGAILEYTKRIELVSLFSSLAVSALSYLLSSKIALLCW